MEHVAIDIGGRESQICARSPSGDIVLERRHRTADLEEFLRAREPSVVVLETCSEAFAIADIAREAGHRVRVVSATLVRELGVGARGIKTDVRDARALSSASCRMDLPSVHVPATVSRERKTICGMRDGLVESRTKLINAVRGWLRATARRPKSGHGGELSETRPGRSSENRRRTSQRFSRGLMHCRSRSTCSTRRSRIMRRRTRHVAA